MKPRLKSTPAARALIKAHEPFHANARQRADGRWAVGYGHTASAKPGVSVTDQNADLLLVYDVLQAERAIDEALGGELGAPQRDALVSFAHGIGLDAFRRSAVVRLIRKGRWQDAADAIAAWNGGGSDRHEAERELFLKDIPEDDERAPVELVIEFDHPNDEPVAAEPEPQPEPEPEAVSVDESAPETVPEPEPEPEVTPEPAPVRPAPAVPGRSELAERVILRMRTQLSGPVRETGYAPAVEADTPEDEPVSEPEANPQPSGRMGFAFTQSVPIEDDDEPIADSDDAPPFAGAAMASAEGAAGEVAGHTETADEAEGEDHADDLPEPSEIDAEFAEGDAQAAAMNGWSNGDAAPAPGKNGGHLGEIILLIFGLALLGGGGWDIFTRVNSDGDGANLFIGVAALVVGFIFAAGATIWLIGPKRK